MELKPSGKASSKGLATFTMDDAEDEVRPVESWEERRRARWA